MTTWTYDAVVDTDEKKGDFVLPSAAFTAGRLNVFMRPGVYYESSDVVIPDGAALTGALRGQCIIDFGNNNASVRCGVSGAPTVESSGTIEVVSGSAEVVGTDTVFTNLASGNFLAIHDNYYEIANITDATNLTLLHNYNGKSEEELSFRALSMQSYNRLNNFMVRNSAGTGVVLHGCRRPVVENVTVDNCYTNADFTSVAEGVFRFVMFEFSTTGVGLSLTDVDSSTFSMMQLLSNYSHGVALGGVCNNILFHDVETSSNGGCGMYVNGVFRDGNLTNCVSKFNYTNGIYVGSGGDWFVMNASAVGNNSANGVESHGDRGIFTNNTCKYNGGNGLETTGDFCLVGKNIGYGNVMDGVRISGSACNICDNSFTTSGDNCCHIMTNASDNIVTGNHFDGAGVTTLCDEGSSSVTDNNKP